MQPPRYKIVVMGMSAGGMEALKIFIPALPAAFPMPIAIVQHNRESFDGFLADYLNRIGEMTIKEAEDKEPLCPGCAYLAPPGYHLLVEDDLTFSLSANPRVNYCCPSIDVLFESAADVFGDAVIGVVLTGANSDGSQGLKTIKEHGGLAIVQTPETAASRAMPQAALAAVADSLTVNLENLTPLLTQLSELRNGDEYDSAIRA